MAFDYKTILSQVVLALSDPRASARWVINHGIPTRQAWEILLVVILANVVLAGILSITLGGSLEGAGFLGPFGLTALQAAFLWLLVHLVDKVGRKMGGVGTLAQSILVIAWMQVVLLVLQVALLIIFQIIPVGPGYVNIIAVGFFFWLLSNFVTELHGFSSRLLVFIGILVGMFAFGLLLSLIFALLGVEISGSA